LRIALFHNLPSGGAKRAVYEWSRRLSRDHQLDVYTLSTADHVFCDIRRVVNTHQEYPFRLSRTFGSPFGRLNQLQRWRDLGRLVRVNRRLATRIDAGRYDVVFAHTCQFTFIPALIRFVDSPTVYFLHEPFGRAAPLQCTVGRRDSFTSMLDRVDPLIRVFRNRLDRLQAQSVAAAGELLANSRYTGARMEKGYARETPVCRYGVDVQAFASMHDVRREPHVLSVGELSPRKGFGFLIEALGLIPLARRPPLRLACNSAIPAERERIERLAAERCVRLEIKTDVPTTELVREYNHAALCVYAPVNEPFGLVPLEAMACGTPVVAVREGGVPESVVDGRTGVLVERDTGRFADAVESLLGDEQLLAEYGRNARDHVAANWTWERSVEELERHLVRIARVARRAGETVATQDVVDSAPVVRRWQE
jgi:glycosyltransferase involved in cell wall biosynthesis